MNRFFKKSDRIDSLSDYEIEDFLRKENILNKVKPERVKDFYNAFSTMSSSNAIEEEEVIDYSHYGCKNRSDKSKIDQMKTEEMEYIKAVNKESYGGNQRLLKLATTVAHQFEVDQKNGDDLDPSSLRDRLFNLFQYEDEHGENDDGVKNFGDMLELDVNFMKYLALLSKKKAFEVLQGQYEDNPSGNIIKYKIMDSMEQVLNMDLIQIVMPDFKVKMAIEDIYVRKRFIKTDKAQNLVIMIDDSGSMSNNTKKQMLQAAVTIKLRDFNEVHNVYIGTFITENYGFHKVKEGDLFSDLTFIELNKGTTDINGCVKDVIKQIKGRKLKDFNGGFHTLDDSHFEILIINDGDDHVDPSFHPDIKLHAVCLCQHNTNLKNICHRSGGTYNHLKHE